MAIKILVISRTPWNINNSFGNSYENIFTNLKDIEICNLYCDFGYPKSKIVKKFYRINEKTMIKKILGLNKTAIENVKIDENKFNNKEVNFVNRIKKLRYWFFYLLRDLVWSIGNWKDDGLLNAIKIFNPDIIFQPIYFSTYMNDIVYYVKKNINKPIIGYVSDDVYFYRFPSYSLYFLCKKFLVRLKVKKVIKNCELLYVITERQKKDYEKYFKIKCKVLTKGYEFSDEKKNEYDSNKNQIIKIVYTGNLAPERFQSLLKLAKLTDYLNSEKKHFEIDVYSGTILSNKNIKDLNKFRSLKYYGEIDNELIPKIQKDSDILLFLESDNKIYKEKIKYSFSTKLIDYFFANRTILAIGPRNIAPIEYLDKNDSALIAENEKELQKILNNIIKNRNILSEYAEKAWNCGVRNHQREKIQTELLNDIKIIKETGLKNESS